MNKTAYKKIIFIDDDVELVNIYNSILKQKNLSKYLIHFKNGKEGIDYLKKIENKEELPDYILLDLYMPQMNGFQFLSDFERMDEIKDSVEIYVCSSSRKKADRDKVMKYPYVSAYLEKPLSSDFIELLIQD
jgi:response regulator RpfG family c-di-GMP phosphodiesterase